MVWQILVRIIFFLLLFCGEMMMVEVHVLTRKEWIEVGVWGGSCSSLAAWRGWKRCCIHALHHAFRKLQYLLYSIFQYLLYSISWSNLSLKLWVTWALIVRKFATFSSANSRLKVCCAESGFVYALMSLQGATEFVYHSAAVRWLACIDDVCCIWPLFLSFKTTFKK